MPLVFLALDEVLALHEDQIRRYGGRPGLRDVALLSSAMGAVSATFGGELLHPSPFELAGAYMFYLAKDRAFVDGNKRVALAAALTFLWMNDLEVEADDDALTELVLGVAEGRISKSEVAVFLQRHARPRGS